MRTMLDRDSYLKLLEIIGELAEKAESGSVILVEGKKDEEALRKMGIRGEIVAISQKSLSRISDFFMEREVIVLTDWDESGRRLEENLRRVLYNADFSLRRELIKVVGKWTTRVEDLPAILELFERNIKI